MARKTEAEIREAEERILADHAKAAEDVLYLGGDPAEDEEREYKAAKAEERAYNDETPVTRGELERLLSELKRSTELAAKLAKDRGTDLDKVVLETSQLDRQKQREAFYATLRAQGIEKVKVQFTTSDAPGGYAPVYASHNGHPYYFPRGVPVDVPLDVLAIIDNAEVQNISPEVMPDGSFKQVARYHLRFPYHRLDGPIYLGT